MRQISLLFLIGVGLTCTFAGAAGQDRIVDRKAIAELQGIWKLSSLEHLGEARDAAERQVYWVVKGDKVLYGGQPLAKMSPDGATTPRCIDLDFHAPKVEREGIYEVKDKRWMLCVNWDAEGVKERPQEFSTKDKPGLRVLVLERVTISEAEAAASGMGYVGIAIGKLKEGGLYVNNVLPDSPAKKVGLKQGDQILQVAGADAAELLATVRAIQQVRPGSEVVVRVKRDGQDRDFKIKAGLVPFHFLLQ